MYRRCTTITKIRSAQQDLLAPVEGSLACTAIQPATRGTEMSTALFVVLQREIEGFDASNTNGQAISPHFETLDEICEEIGLRPLSSLTSMNPDELADLLGNDPLEEDLTGLPEEVQQAAGEVTRAVFDANAEIAEHSVPAEEWFSPTEGLTVIRGLQAHISTHRKSVSLSPEVLEDLAELEQVLATAAEYGVPFHFSWDF